MMTEYDKIFLLIHQACALNGLIACRGRYNTCFVFMKDSIPSKTGFKVTFYKNEKIRYTFSKKSTVGARSAAAILSRQLKESGVEK